METAHTPGPWYEASTGNHQGLVISEATGANMAVVYDSKDARLIAAAPELLAALSEGQRLADIAAGNWESGDLAAEVRELAAWAMEARAAIAKATGE